MLRDSSGCDGDLEERVGTAPVAPEHGLLQPDAAERGVWPGAGAAQPAGAALRAHPGADIPTPKGLELFFGRLYVAFVLLDAALKLRVLRLQITATSLKCRLLGLQEPKVLAKHRRTAVLVDELLDQFQWVHGLPLQKVHKRAARAAEESARG
jgi:hypothetical protein